MSIIVFLMVIVVSFKLLFTLMIRRRLLLLAIMELLLIRECILVCVCTWNFPAKHDFYILGFHQGDNGGIHGRFFGLWILFLLMFVKFMQGSRKV